MLLPRFPLMLRGGMRICMGTLSDKAGRVGFRTYGVCLPASPIQSLKGRVYWEK